MSTAHKFKAVGWRQTVPPPTDGDNDRLHGGCDHRAVTADESSPNDWSVSVWNPRPPSRAGVTRLEASSTPTRSATRVVWPSDPPASARTPGIVYVFKATTGETPGAAARRDERHLDGMVDGGVFIDGLNHRESRSFRWRRTVVTPQFDKMTA